MCSCYWLQRSFARSQSRLATVSNPRNSGHMQYRSEKELQWYNHFLRLAFAPPLITGETVINEGATLNLICNASNSYPLPRVQWFNPDGEMVGDGGFLNIVNIHRNMGGVYTCVASQNSATTSSTISVTVNVPCELFSVLHCNNISVTCHVFFSPLCSSGLHRYHHSEC